MIKHSFSSLAQIELQETHMISFTPWSCMLVLGRAAKTNVALPFWLAGTTNTSIHHQHDGSEVSHFTHPTLLRGKRQTACVAEQTDWNAPIPFGNQSETLLTIHLLHSIPTWIFLTYHTTSHFLGMQWTVDILICGPLLVLFPLLGILAYTEAWSLNILFKQLF